MRPAADIWEDDVNVPLLPRDRQGPAWKEQLEQSLNRALAQTRRDFEPDEELVSRLQHHLRDQPPWVRQAINSFFDQELQSSYQRVAGQLREFKAYLEECVHLDSSQEAQDLKRALRSLRDSDIQALEHDARGIRDGMRGVLQCIDRHDFASLQQIAKAVEKKARRFSDKYNAIKESLGTLAKRCQELKLRFQRGKEKSLRLLSEVEGRRDWWVDVLSQAGAAIATSAAVAGGLTAGVFLTPPVGVLVGVGSLAALLMIGRPAREVLKALLTRLWKTEIEKHETSAKAFEAMETVMQERAEHLLSLMECNSTLSNALAAVCETALKMEMEASDAEDVSPPEGPVAEEMLSKRVETLSATADALAVETASVLPAAASFRQQVHQDAPMGRIIDGFCSVGDSPLAAGSHAAGSHTALSRSAPPRAAGP